MSNSNSFSQTLREKLNGVANRELDLTSCGAALVDTEIAVEDAALTSLRIDKGVMTLVDKEQRESLLKFFAEDLKTAEKSGGGSAANSLITASLLGKKSFLSCRVGQDDNGHQFLRDMANAGVSTNRNAQGCDETTGQCLVMISPDAERTMCTHLGASALLSKKEVDEKAISTAKILYIEGYQVAADAGYEGSLYAFDVAKKADTITAMSLSDPAMATYFNERIHTFLEQGVDILFCNEDEARATAKLDKLEEAIEQIKHHCELLVVTQGENGALLVSESGQHSVSGVPTKAIDTNGAGDTFAGAFLSKLLDDASLAECAQFANRAASLVVSQYKPRLDRGTLQALRAEQVLAAKAS